METKTHLISIANNASLCGKAIVGDRGITEEQAFDRTNGMTFDCDECFNIMLSQLDPTEQE